MEAMREAAAHLIGTKDFKCFQAAGGKELESTVRTIYSSRLTCTERDQIEYEITGDGFLYNMVRIITGTLVDVGLGKKRPDELPDIIAGRDRRMAGHTAPPQGLYLAEVFFEAEALRRAADPK
jgi:tRNA pseudouridine38-40 synthase